MQSNGNISEKLEDETSLCDALALEHQAVVSLQNCTKRTAVRLAISNSINLGVLRPGDYLPSEKVLAKILGVSLGTVQVALGQLRDVGLVQRRRGDGTRVSDADPFPNNIWHFRFLSHDSNTPLRMVDSKLKLSKTSSAGYWSKYLGIEKYYICIARKVRMHDGTRVTAEMHIPGGISKDLSDVDVSELEMINIRPFLETRLDLRIRERTSRVSVVTPKIEETKNLGLSAPLPHYEINATAFTDDKKPAYHQRILVPVSDCILEF